MAMQQSCPEERELQALLESVLSEERQATLVEHIERCAQCRQQLEELAGGADLPSLVTQPGDPSEKPSFDFEQLVRSLKTQAALETTVLRSPSEETVSLDFLKPTDRPDCLGRLGNYEIFEVVGQGGMGVVLRGLDTRLNRVVAIKVLSPQLASSAIARRRFLREAQKAAAVTHDHVVAIHAIDESEGLPFIVMEYIVGLSLEDRIKKTGPLKLDEILRIGMQAASGLAAAHAQGLVHRDIKPSNILLENGVERVKISDFGLARASDDAQITKTGEIAGTPEYMSPEQAKGDILDHRSDLFSLGCVLYAMCVGRSPFRAKTVVDAIRRVCEDTPRSIREVNSEIPDWLMNIVDHLLAKEPAERLQSAEEVAALLGGHLAHLQRPGEVGKPVKLPPRHKTPQSPNNSRPVIWAATALAIVLGVTALFVAVNASRKPIVADDEQPPQTIPSNSEITASAPAGNSVFESVSQPHFVCITFGSRANIGLTEDTNETDNNLGDLQPCEQWFAGCPFWIAEKYIMLQGQDNTSAPEVVQGIPVNAFAEKLHFFHGSRGGTAEDNRQIAQYEIRYVDGKKEIVPLVLGTDVTDWWSDNPVHLTRGKVAWLGSSNQAAQSGKMLQLFQQSWLNPRPDVKILDLSVRKTPGCNASLICLAISAESPKDTYEPSEFGRLTVDFDWSCEKGLVLEKEGRRISFFGRMNTQYEVPPGNYDARIVQQTPEGEIVLRQGTRQLAANTLACVKFRSASGGNLIATPQPTPAREFLHNGHVFDVDISPDGSKVVSALDTGKAYVRDLSDAEDKPVILELSGGYVTKCAFSEDGKFLALASESGTIAIYDASSLQTLHQIKAHDKDMWALTFSPDGTLASSSYSDSLIRFWNPHTGTLVSEHKIDTEHAAALKFSPDGGLLATCDHPAKTCTIWETTTWTKRCTLEAKVFFQWPFCFSPDSKCLFTAGFDGVARAWNTSNGQLIRAFYADFALWSVGYVPDRNVLLGIGGDSVIRGWNVNTGQLVFEFPAHWGSIRGVKVAPDSKTFATASNDDSVRIWRIDELPMFSRLRTPQPAATLATLCGDPAINAAFYHSGKSIVAVNAAGKTHLWDIEEAQETQRLEERKNVAFGGTALSADGATLAVLAGGRQMRFYDLLHPKSSRILDIQGELRFVEFLPNTSDLVISRWDECCVELWDSETRQRRWSSGHLPGIPGIPVISPDGNRVAVGTSEGRIVILSVETGRQLREPLRHGPDRCVTTAFSADGSKLVSGSQDRTVKIWDTSTDYQLVATLEGHLGEIVSTNFSPDNKFLVTSDVSDMEDYAADRVWQNAGMIILWDVQKKQPLVKWKSHNGAVASVRFSPDGARIVSSGRDGLVHIWDVEELLKWGKEQYTGDPQS